jgi:hypothetical protein
MFKWFGELWCRQAHGRLMWPVNGHYICSTCLREYPVHWEKYEALRSDKGAVHDSTYLTRSNNSTAVNGFGKKCTSVTATP